MRISDWSSDVCSSDLIVVEVDDNNLTRYGASTTALYDHLKDLGFTPTRRRFDEQHFDEVFVRTEESAQQAGEPVVVPFDARRRRKPEDSGRSVARRLPRDRKSTRLNSSH